MTSETASADEDAPPATVNRGGAERCQMGNRLATKTVPDFR
jgi:hypothetical protein